MGKVYCLTWGIPTSGKGLLFNKQYRDEWKGSLTWDAVTRWRGHYSRRTHRAHNHVTLRVYLRSKFTFWTEAHVHM